MVKVFNVYARQTANGVEQWGLETSGAKRQAIHVKAGRVVDDRLIALGAIGQQIGSWARSGFKCSEVACFFDEATGVFDATHPDFRADPAYLVFSEPVDVERAVADLETLLARAAVQAGVPQDYLRKWLSRQDLHAQYLVATAEHPVFALAVSEQAINSGWELFGRYPGLPERPPSAAPLEWVQWLSSSFAEPQIHEAHKALGGGVAMLLANQSPVAIGAPASHYL